MLGVDEQENPGSNLRNLLVEEGDATFGSAK
jgi:hypothetical protein